MKLLSLKLHNFRNHQDSVLECAEQINVLLGQNGQGKTNILEAISYLCLTKSFYASSDATALSIGESFFEAKGKFLSDQNIETDVRVSYDLESGEKIFTLNRITMEGFSSVIGRFPVVVLSPENNAITFGGPAERRKFIDLDLSQTSKAYLQDLLEYRRVLKQRNRILTEAKTTHSDLLEELVAWNESLVKYGSRVFERRQRFLQQFQPYVCEAYQKLTVDNEQPSLEYQPAIDVANSANGIDVGLGTFQKAFEVELEENQSDELRLGTTLVGPHRDDVVFKINGMDLRKYASQGQHKTFLIALKIAEFFYLKELNGETPIVLLDDAFSELDGSRKARLTELLQQLGQTFITVTTPLLFTAGTGSNRCSRTFFVERGTIRYEKI